MLAAFGLMGVALVMAVVAWFYLSRKEEAPAPPPVAAAAAPAPPPRTRDADTGTPRQKAPAPRRQSSAAPAPPREAPAPRATNGTVTIAFAGDIAGLTGVEITCTDGFRQRGPLSGTSVSIGGVPTAGDCVAIPKGKAGTKTVVRGGGQYSCQFVGTTLSCR